MPLPKFAGVKTPPKYEAKFMRFMNPLLDVMREKGGQARPREIYNAIAQRLNLSEEERSVTNKNGYPRFENQIAWARSYLVKTGYLDSPSRGIWRLTDKGKEAHLDGPDIDSIFRRVMEMNTLAEAGIEMETTAESSPKKPSTKDGEDEVIAPSPQTSPYSDHRPALITLPASGRRWRPLPVCESCSARSTASRATAVRSGPP
jgi:restriction system protein